MNPGAIHDTVADMLGTLVTVYVRKGRHDSERRISFRILPGMDTAQLVESGIALDGNEAVFFVGRRSHDDNVYYFGPLGDEQGPDTLIEALLAQQRALIKLLRDQGFKVTFA